MNRWLLPNMILEYGVLKMICKEMELSWIFSANNPMKEPVVLSWGKGPVPVSREKEK